MELREARCHLIATILAADGLMTDDERETLRQAVDAAGLTEDEAHRVHHFDGWDQAEAVMRAAPEETRREVLDALVEAALADGKLTQKETAEVKRIAAALGLE